MNAITATATVDETAGIAPAPARPRAFGWDVPHWAHFAAVDRDGRAYAFACEPMRDDRAGVWSNAALGGRVEQIGDFRVDPIDGWHHALLKLVDGCWIPVDAYQVTSEPDDEERPGAHDWNGLAIICGAWAVFAVLVACAVAGDRLEAWWRGVLPL